MLATSQNSIGAERGRPAARRRGQVMKRMAAFMQQRLNIPLHAGGVHEDERLPRFFQRH